MRPTDIDDATLAAEWKIWDRAIRSDHADLMLAQARRYRVLYQEEMQRRGMRIQTVEFVDRAEDFARRHPGEVVGMVVELLAEQMRVGAVTVEGVGGIIEALRELNDGIAGDERPGVAGAAVADREDG